MLRLEGIRKSCRLSTVEVPLLRGIDLDVKAGDFMAIMGPPGSGQVAAIRSESGSAGPQSPHGDINHGQAWRERLRGSPGSR